jgi:hypothetical protein
MLNDDIDLRAVYVAHPAAIVHKKVYINEMSGNDKWLEIYNDEDEAVDLTGYVIQKIDEDGLPANWTIPAGTTITAKGFLSWKQNVGNGFTWGISAKKDVAFKIFDATGAELDYFEVRSNLYSDGGDKSVGRTPNGGTQLVVFQQSTRDASNVGNGQPDPEPTDPPTLPAPPVITSSIHLYINEISGNEKWLEIYNAENAPLNLTGYTIRKIDEEGKPADWVIPAGTSIAAKGFLAWTQNEPNSFTWGISASKDVAFVIIDSQGDTADYFEVRSPLYSGGNGKTVGRATDGGNTLVVFLTGSKGASNRLISNNTQLSAWVVNDVVYPVSDNSASYQITVDNSVSEAVVVAIAKDSTTLHGTGTYPLTIGNNPINITVIAEDSVTTADYILTIIRANSTAIAVEANNYLPLQIYPNPVINGQLTMDNGQLKAGDKVEIYNVNGGLTGVYNVSGGASTAISIGHLPAGIYIVKVGNRAAKIVKQ